MQLLCSVVCLTAHVSTSPHNFVDEEELLGENWRNVKELSLNDVVVPNVRGCRWNRLSSQDIDTESIPVFDVFFLDLQ